MQTESQHGALDTLEQPAMLARAKHARLRHAGITQQTGKIVDRSVARKVDRAQTDTSRNISCSCATTFASQHDKPSCTLPFPCFLPRSLISLTTCPNWFTTAAHPDFNVVAFSSLLALEANQDIIWTKICCTALMRPLHTQSAMRMPSKGEVIGSQNTNGIAAPSGDD